MDGHRALLPTSPTLSVQAEDTASARDHDVASAQKDGEKTPLLEGSRDVEVVGKTKRTLNLRSIALVIVLWFSTLSISAAYSMIAPFFPKQASSEITTSVLSTLCIQYHLYITVLYILIMIRQKIKDVP